MYGVRTRTGSSARAGVCSEHRRGFTTLADLAEFVMDTYGNDAAAEFAARLLKAIETSSPLIDDASTTPGSAPLSAWGRAGVGCYA